MNRTANVWVKTLVTASGFALAGPSGALIGKIAGGLLTTVLPGISGVAGDVISRLVSRAVEQSGSILGERLSAEDRTRINHDLQTAFRDAYNEALFDLGGKHCFSQAWRTRRDVPARMVYPSTPQANRLWRDRDPLAQQVCDCLNAMRSAVEAGQLLPLDPPLDRPASDVRIYLEAETPESLNNLFFDQVISPFLSNYRTLTAELPGFETHLRHYLLDRTLVHLGELLKARTPAWRAFNRMLLEEVRAGVKEIGSSQEQLLARLDLLLDRASPEPLEALSDGLAELLSASGRIEKQLGEGFDSLTQRLAKQHGEALARFEALIVISGRIETKVDRVLRILEDGRFVIEGTPSVPVDLPPEPGDPPFKGLQFFDQADADLFFGRELLTARLIGRLTATLAPVPEDEDTTGLQFLAIIGASGSGKSSVVRAGLIPALQRADPLADGSLPPSGSYNWPIHLITPSAHPLEALAASLTRGAEPAATSALLASLESNPNSLRLHARQLLSPRNEGSPEAGPTGSGYLLLVVDQFEELFTLCRSDSERVAFIDNLLMACSDQGPVILVITLRADFYQHCARYENLRAALESQQAYIGPMNPAELRSAIDAPARRGDWQFEPGLVDLFLREVGEEPGALPLLSHALLETWKHRRGRVMTLESYAESGGVSGAIAKTAETVFYQRLNPEQQAIARNIFLRLTEPGEGTQDTRRRVVLEEILPSQEENPQVATLTSAVLKILTEARLVTASQGEVEVAHEALIREWPTLQKWLDEDRAGLRLHRQLTEAAQDWARLSQETAVLYRGTRLAQAIEWAEDHPDQLSQMERQFLASSKALSERLAAEKEAGRQRELQAARQLAEEADARRQAEADRARLAEQSSTQLRARNRVITIVGLVAGAAAILACLLAVATGFFGLRSSQNATAARQNLATAQAASTLAVAEANTRATAEADALQQKSAAEASGAEALRQSRISLAREIAARSASVLDRDQDLGVLLALASVKIASSFGDITIPEAQTSLFHALQVARYAHVLRNHSDAVWVAMFSPDGQRILTASKDGTAALWSAGGALIASLRGHSDQVLFATFSPDGSLIATASADGTARLWDGKNGKFLRALQGHTDWVNWVAFSPDGKQVLTASGDQTARLWSLDGTQIESLEGHTNWVTAAAFSPDGQRIVTTSFDNSLRIWQLDGTLVAELKSHTGWPVMFSFSPDGTRLASAGWDGVAKIWSLEDGELLGTLSGHTRSVNSVVFSPDGERLLTASYDGTARLWDPSGETLSILQGHAGPVVLAIFSLDGERLLTSSWDNTARLWHSDGTPIATLHGHTDLVYTALFNPAGTRILTSSEDGTARLWELSDIAPERLVGHSSQVNTVTFSQDGSKMLTAGNDGTARVWSASGKQLLNIELLHGPATAASFSPDGSRLVIAYFDKTAMISSAIDGRQITELNGHTDTVSWASYSPDGKLIVTASWDKTARLWQADGTFLRALEGHTEALNTAVFSPDGSLVLTCSDDFSARLWELDGSLAATLNGHSAPVHSAVFSPDGQFILTAAYDRTARLWRLDGSLVRTFEGHPDLLYFATFSPDGSLVATASVDGTAWLWRVDGKFIAALEGHRSWVTSLAFSPDGRHLATTSEDGSVRIWDIHGDLEVMQEVAAQQVGRDLSEIECQVYLHQQDCSEPSTAPDS